MKGGEWKSKLLSESSFQKLEIHLVEHRDLPNLDLASPPVERGTWKKLTGTNVQTKLLLRNPTYFQFLQITTTA